MKPTLVLCSVFVACGTSGVQEPSSLAPQLERPDAGRPKDVLVDVQVGEVGYCTRSALGEVECHDAAALSGGADFTVVDGGATAMAVSGTTIWHEELLGCALVEADRVVCMSPLRRNEVRVPGARRLALGDAQACALTDVGEVWCWNPMDDSHPGDRPPPPERVPQISHAVDVVVGSSFACTLDTSSAVHCWGVNNLDDPKVPEGLRAKAIAAGTYHACAVQLDDTLRCWGSGDPFPTAEPVTAVGCGFAKTCWLNPSGRAVCTGGRGQRLIPSLPPLTLMSVGAYGVCGLEANGAVDCASFGIE